jgi:hypothetical protein
MIKYSLNKCSRKEPHLYRNMRSSSFLSLPNKKKKKDGVGPQYGN